MVGVIDYRKDVEDAVERVAPVVPLEFLHLLFESTRTEAQQLRNLTISELDEEVYDKIDQLVSEVIHHSCERKKYALSESTTC